MEQIGTNDAGTAATRNAVYRIAQSAAGAENLASLCKAIHDILQDLMPARNFYVALYDEERDLVSYPYWVDEHDPPPSPSPPGRGLTSHVLRSGQPLWASPELFDDPLWSDLIHPGGTPALNWLGAPLRVRKHTVGVLAIQSYEPHVHYSMADRDMLVFVANQVAMVLERQRSDDARRESQRALSTLVSNLPGVAYRCEADEAWTMRYVSEGCLALTGYAPADLINSQRVSYGELMHPNDRAFVREAVGSALANHSRYHVEYRIRTADNREKWVWEWGQGIWDDSGELVALEGFISDISERRRAEQLERQQRRAAELLDEVVLALSSQTDRSGLLDEILRQAQRIVPFDAANIMLAERGRLTVAKWVGYEEFGSEAFVADWQQDLNHFPLDRSTWELTTPLVVEDTHNEPSWVTLPATSWIRSMLAVPIRLQDRKLGLIRIDSASPHRFSAGDAERVQPLANAAAIALENVRLIQDAKQRAGELEVLRRASLSLTSTLDLPDVLDAILKHALHLLPADNTHVFLLDASGELRFGAACWRDGRPGTPFRSARPGGLTATVARTGKCMVIPDANRHALFQDWQWGGAIVSLPLIAKEKVIGVMNIAFAAPREFPASDLRILELLADQGAIAIENAQLYDQVRSHAVELEQRVDERTAALRAANERLKELDRLKSQFVSNVSHELRTPLTNIKAYLYLLEHGKPEKRAQYMATLDRETDLLQKLIEDLLQLSRLDLGRTHVELAPLDVNNLVGMLAEDRVILIENRGLSLQTQLDAGLPKVVSDRRLLVQVLTNLMTNAMNYTPAGGMIRVSTALRREEAELALRREPDSEGRDAAPDLAIERERDDEGGEGDSAAGAAITPDEWVTISIADDGPGMSPDEQEHIFERFFRGTAALQTTVAGTGLGLSISQEICRMLGGRITVESAPHAGSVFTVWLPAHQKPEAD